MQITKMSREFTKAEQYLLTKSASIIPVKAVEDGDTIEVSGYLTFTDTNSKGETSEMLSIMGTDGRVWSCQSETFKRNFYDLCNIFGDENFSIKKLSGVTSAGRDFVNCDLAI